MQPPDDRIRRVASRLRYQPLPHLFGQQVLIHSLQAIRADVRSALLDGSGWLGEIAVEQADLRRTVAKYGTLTLVFDAPSDLLTSGFETGMDLLEALGFIMSAAEAREFIEVAQIVGDNFDDPTLLGELEADLAEGQTYLHLLLRGDLPDKARPLAHDDLPADYFPHLFTVEDAALSNAWLAWVHKY